MTDRQETFTVSAAADLNISLPSGKVAIRNGAADTIDVSISGRRADEFEVSNVGNSVSVRLDGRGFGSASHHLEIAVPTDCRVDISSASADCDVQTVAQLDVRIASGDVRVTRVDGDMAIKSASGDVTVGEVVGRASVASASGDVNISTAKGDCSFNSASGDIDVRVVEGDFEGKSASGDLTVNRFVGSRFVAKTMSGDIEVSVPKGTILDVDMYTMSGRVRLPEPGNAVIDGERPLVDVACKSVSGDMKVGLLNG